MSFVTVLAIAVGLGIDAFSVAIGIGAASSRKTWGPVVRLASAFGLFQFGMAVLGWLAGLTLVAIISAFDHWVAFALLVLVGFKMIREGFEDEAKSEKSDQTRGWPLLVLSVATSIDSLAVGFSFSILKNEILRPAVIIGIVCFLMTGIGMLFGKVLAKIFGRKVEIFGGLVLIAIGIKILVDHWR